MYKNGFKSIIQNDKTFQNTNDPWNDMCLNRSWSVGTLMNIFKNHPLNSIDEMKQFYYNSGLERQNQLNIK